MTNAAPRAGVRLATLGPLAVPAVVGLAALAWRGYRNALDVRVEEHTLQPRGLPANLDGVRLLLLSDLHLPGVAGAASRLLALVRGREADATLIAGDLVDTQAGMAAALEVAEALVRVRPTYAVFGSHDHYEPRFSWEHFPRAYLATNDASQFHRELEQRGVSVLVNERMRVRTGDGAFELIGVDDPFLALDDLDRAIGKRPLDGFSVLLSHSPDILPAATERGIPLVLSGHTHGGQIAFPFVGAPFTHSRWFRWRQPAGLLRHGDTLVYVGRGFGTTTLPLRFNAPPEVALLTLRRSDG